MLQHRWTLRTLWKVKQASHEKTNTTWFYLYEGHRVVKYTEKESEMGVARGWEGKWELLCNGLQSLGRWKNSGDWLHNNMNMDLIWTLHFKMNMKVNYMFILPQLSFKNKNPPKPQITHYLKCWPNKQKHLIQFLLCLEEQMGWYKPHLEEYTVKTDYNQSKCN